MFHVKQNEKAPAKNAKIHVRIPEKLRLELERETQSVSALSGIPITLSQYVVRILERRKR